MIIQRKPNVDAGLVTDRARPIRAIQDQQAAAISRPPVSESVIEYRPLPEKPIVSTIDYRPEPEPKPIVSIVQYEPDRTVRIDYDAYGPFQEIEQPSFASRSQRLLPAPPERGDQDEPVRLGFELIPEYETRHSETPFGSIVSRRPIGYEFAPASNRVFELIGSLHKPSASELGLWAELRPGRFEQRLLQSPTLDRIELDSYTIESASYKHPYIESAHYTIENGSLDDPVFRQLVQLITGETPTPYNEQALREYASSALDRFQRGAPETTQTDAIALAHQIARIYDQSLGQNWLDEWRELRERVLLGGLTATNFPGESPAHLMEAALIDVGAPRGFASGVLGALQKRSVQREDTVASVLEAIRAARPELTRDKTIGLAGARINAMIPDGVENNDLVRNAPDYVVKSLQSLSKWELEQGVSDPFWTSPDAVDQLAVGLAFFASRDELIGFSSAGDEKIDIANLNPMIRFIAHRRGSPELKNAVFWLATHYTKLWDRISQRSELPDDSYHQGGVAYNRVDQLAQFLSDNPEYIKLLLMIYMDDQAHRFFSQDHPLVKANLSAIAPSGGSQLTDHPFAKAVIDRALADLTNELDPDEPSTPAPNEADGEPDLAEQGVVDASDINRIRTVYLSRYAYRIGVDLSVALFQLAMAHNSQNQLADIARAYSVVITQFHKLNRTLWDRAQVETESSLYRPFDSIRAMLGDKIDQNTSGWTLYVKSTNAQQAGGATDLVADNIEKQKALLRQLQMELGYYKSAYGSPYYTGGGLQASRDLTEINRVVSNAAVVLYDRPLASMKSELGSVDEVKALFDERMNSAASLKAMHEAFSGMTDEDFRDLVNKELVGLIGEIKNARSKPTENERVETLIKIFRESTSIDSALNSTSEPTKLVRAMLVWSLLYTIYTPGFYRVDRKDDGAYDVTPLLDLILSGLDLDDRGESLSSLIDFAKNVAAQLNFTNQSASGDLFYALGQLIAYSPDMALGLLLNALPEDHKDRVVDSVFGPIDTVRDAIRSMGIENLNILLANSNEQTISSEADLDAAVEKIAKMMRDNFIAHLTRAPHTFLKLFTEQTGFALTNLSIDSALVGLATVTNRSTAPRGGKPLVQIAVELGDAFDPIAQTIESKGLVGWAHLARFTPSHMGHFANDFDDVGVRISYGAYMARVSDRTSFNLKNRHAKFLANRIARSINQYKNTVVNNTLLVYASMIEGLLVELGQLEDQVGPLGEGVRPNRLRGSSAERADRVALGVYVGGEIIKLLHDLRDSDVGDPYVQEKARSFESTYDSIPQMVRVPFVGSAKDFSPDFLFLVRVAEMQREQLKAELPNRIKRVIETTVATLGYSPSARDLQSLEQDLRETTMRLFRELNRKPIDPSELSTDGITFNIVLSSQVADKRGVSTAIEEVAPMLTFQYPVLAPLARSDRFSFELNENQQMEIVFNKSVARDDTTKTETSRLLEEYRSPSGQTRGPTLIGLIANAQALASLASVAVLSETQDVMAQAHARNYFRRLASELDRVGQPTEQGRSRSPLAQMAALIREMPKFLVTIPHETPFSAPGNLPTSYRLGGKPYYRRPLIPVSRKAIRISELGQAPHPFMDDQLVGLIETYDSSVFKQTEEGKSISSQGFEQLIQLFGSQISDSGVWFRLNDLLGENDSRKTNELLQKFSATGIPGAEVAVQALKQIQSEQGKGTDVHVFPIYAASRSFPFPVPPRINVHSHLEVKQNNRDGDSILIQIHRSVDLVFPIAIVYTPGSDSFQVIYSTVRMVFDTAQRPQAHHTQISIPVKPWSVSSFFYKRVDGDDQQLMVSAFPVAQLYKDSEADLLVLEQTIESAMNEMRRLMRNEGDYAATPVFVSFTSSASTEKAIHDRILSVAQESNKIRFVISHPSFSIRDSIRAMVEPRTYPIGSVKGSLAPDAANRALTRAIYPPVPSDFRKASPSASGEIGTTYQSDRVQLVGGSNWTNRAHYSVAPVSIENVVYGVSYTPSYDQPGVVQIGQGVGIPTSVNAQSVRIHRGRIAATPLRTFAAGSNVLESLQAVASSTVFYPMLSALRSFDWEGSDPNQLQALAQSIASALGGGFQSIYNPEARAIVSSEFKEELISFYRAMGYTIDSDRPESDLMKAFEARLKKSNRTKPAVLTEERAVDALFASFALYNFITAVARIARNYMPESIETKTDRGALMLSGDDARAFFYYQIGRLIQIGLEKGLYDGYTGELNRSVVEQLASYLMGAFDPSKMQRNFDRLNEIDLFYTVNVARRIADDPIVVRSALRPAQPAESDDQSLGPIYETKEAMNALLKFKSSYDPSLDASRNAERIETLLEVLSPQLEPFRSITDDQLRRWFGESSLSYFHDIEENVLNSPLPSNVSGSQSDQMRITAALKLLAALSDDRRFEQKDERYYNYMKMALDVVYEIVQSIDPHLFRINYQSIDRIRPERNGRTGAAPADRTELGHLLALIDLLEFELIQPGFYEQSDAAEIDPSGPDRPTGGIEPTAPVKPKGATQPKREDQPAGATAPKTDATESTTVAANSPVQEQESNVQSAENPAVQPAETPAPVQPERVGSASSESEQISLEKHNLEQIGPFNPPDSTTKAVIEFIETEINKFKESGNDKRKELDYSGSYEVFDVAIHSSYAGALKETIESRIRDLKERIAENGGRPIMVHKEEQSLLLGMPTHVFIMPGATVIESNGNLLVRIPIASVLTALNTYSISETGVGRINNGRAIYEQSKHIIVKKILDMIGLDPETIANLQPSETPSQNPKENAPFMFVNNIGSVLYEKDRITRLDLASKVVPHSRFDMVEWRGVKQSEDPKTIQEAVSKSNLNAFIVGQIFFEAAPKYQSFYQTRETN